MSKRSDLHYYPDGDILIIVDNTIFRAHKIILKMAAPTLLNHEQQGNEGNELPFINIPDISASVMDIALSIIYPRYFIMPTWENIDSLLSLASNYVINKIYVAGVTFLYHNFKKNPLDAFYLADKYKLSFLFEETSKLVLDHLPKYKEDPTFQKLPLEIQSALIARHMSYVHSLAELSVNHFLSTYHHTCNNPSFHNKQLNQEIESRVLSILDQPSNITPSKVWTIMLSHININVSDGTDCNSYFMSDHLTKKFNIMFGDFKYLEIDKDEENPKYYIYISRNK
ncbi:uncharacterized protein OCT59_000463 [Rhizophagus irregularis]|uniref:BTB domain-containing protein n=4 Tax=Rhizophagus irregularis TaxID=588596 RepID=A0A015IJA5_RHIIW|nr:hypothetical protein GLOIN_2v1498663 [Rhizophagus irregularis DAOM 181602=DAOM 197198]EXX57252.1 hypothetical protein RirG_208820 [Rhizophagus irregularis DAOM 197198w]UZN99183.1 hypothetical protein OCT59_000463 [Rhizophagus irregularis]POG82452.1 hypothetical protein GLOIN_2v1498663 [Rhizophagus irregularis DAOM 181602=DAOM 197198]CAB4485295.1 unnamed protein product [Rhizophagus irregularis]CAB5181285.1 unnamed protein product [Rhizophagus irregularis]|eukprot:XP_025189318.1 hypothetical protein GLOIN_2v1498663 [Rhizophagus irregularis DAOM 181602=DAOM 197198]